jgi:hypothetical protein
MRLRHQNRLSLSLQCDIKISLSFKIQTNIYAKLKSIMFHTVKYFTSHLTLLHYILITDEDFLVL